MAFFCVSYARSEREGAEVGNNVELRRSGVCSRCAVGGRLRRHPSELLRCRPPAFFCGASWGEGGRSITGTPRACAIWFAFQLRRRWLARIAAIAAGLNEACQRRRGIVVRRMTSRPRFLPECGGELFGFGYASVLSPLFKVSFFFWSFGGIHLMPWPLVRCHTVRQFVPRTYHIA